MFDQSYYKAKLRETRVRSREAQEGGEHREPMPASEPDVVSVPADFWADEDALKRSDPPGEAAPPV